MIYQKESFSKSSFGDLEGLGNRHGEVVPTDWEASEPAPTAFGHDEVAVAGRDVEDDHGLGVCLEIEVVADRIEECDRLGGCT